MNPKLVVNGAAGRMGRRIIALAIEAGRFDIVAAVDLPGHPELGKDVGILAGKETLGVQLGSEYPAAADIMIDFSLPQAVDNVLNVCLAKNIALVMCTTGLVAEQEKAIAAAAADVHAPAANTAAVVTYAAVEAVKHHITGVAWSYDGGIPTNGNLLIEDVSGTTVFTMDITEEGPGFVVFPKPKQSAAVNTAMIITLAAGGAGVTGKISVLNHWTEA